MSVSDYMTETHPAIDEFDIEGQEESGELPPSNDPVDVSERQEQDPPPRDPNTSAGENTEETTDTPPADNGQTKQPEDSAEGDTPTGGEPAGSPESEGQPADDVNPDDLSDIVGPDGKYMTYREAAKATRSLQSMYDKKFAEQNKQIEELQKYREEQQKQWEQQTQQQQEYQQQQAVQQQIQSMTEQQWAHQIDMYPGETVSWAAENYPEAIPGIISHIRATKGDFVADEMLIRYQQGQQQQMMQQQQEQMQQAQQAAQPQPNIETNVENAMKAITDKYGEQFSEMQEDVSAALQSGNYQIDFADPANIAGAVEHAFLAAFRNKAIEQNQQASSQPTAASPQAETGNPGQAGQPVSEEDEIANEIVEQWNNNPYSR